MIEVDHISKTYGTHQALSAVSFRIKSARVFGLLGPNGAGKTTLLRILTQILMPDSGCIKLDGVNLRRQDLCRFAYLPEERGLYKKMKVREHLLYLCRLKGVGKHEANEFVHRWLTKFQAESWQKKRIEELSKGMQQKIQFVAAMTGDPDILILDEPFSGFDPLNAQLIKDEIRALKEQGKTIILSTHDMHSVEELCDDIALIHQSRLLKTGDLHSLKTMFGKNLFELSIPGTDQLPNIETTGIHVVLNECKLQGERKIQFIADDENEGYQLLKHLVAQLHVLQFRQVYPSMQEIFISLVKAVE